MERIVTWHEPSDYAADYGAIYSAALFQDLTDDVNLTMTQNSTNISIPDLQHNHTYRLTISILLENEEEEPLQVLVIPVESYTGISTDANNLGEIILRVHQNKH